MTNQRSTVWMTCALALGCQGLPAEDGALPGETVGELERQVVTGDDGSSTERYLLDVDAATTLELQLTGAEGLTTGQRVAVRGSRVGRRLAVDALRVMGEGTIRQALVGNTVRTRSKMAVLLVDWTAPDGQTRSSMRKKVFTSGTSLRAYYAETSYGLLALEGDVFGWFHIPAPTDCSTVEIRTSARAAATAAGVDLSAFAQTIYYFPRNNACAFSEVTSVGRPDRPARDEWLNGTTGCVALVHNLHNFGALNSGSYRCQGASLAAPSSCQQATFGDLYDGMGSGCFQVNVAQKAAQGWFGKCNAVSVTASATVDLVPTELPSNGVQSLRVPLPASLCPPGLTTCELTVESRQPLGAFDARGPAAMFQGVLVHASPVPDLSGGGTRGAPSLLDMTPATAGNFADAALTVGSTLAIPGGARITLLSRTADKATVKVEIDGGTGAPTCIDGSTLGGAACAANIDCPPGQSCVSGVCR